MKLTQLFGHSYSATDLTDGDLLPIGGNIFQDNTGQDAAINLRIDVHSFDDFFDKCDSFYQENIDKLSQGDANLRLRGVAPQIANRLFVFNRILAQTFPGNPAEDECVRQKFYTDRKEAASLSESFKSGNAMCGEYSALAQLYLQHCGFEASCVTGEVMWDRKQEFAGSHTYVSIKQTPMENAIIFDPVNFYKGENGKVFPRINLVDAETWERAIKRGRDQPQYIATKSIQSGRAIYYGFGRGTNVREENIIDAPAARAKGPANK